MTTTEDVHHSSSNTDGNESEIVIQTVEDIITGASGQSLSRVCTLLRAKECIICNIEVFPITFSINTILAGTSVYAYRCSSWRKGSAQCRIE